MKFRNAAPKCRTRKAQAGASFVETVVALSILLVVATGVLGLAAIAIGTTENQGHLAARTTEYAQDKMEQLMALPFCDGVSDTRVFPAANAGGTGLADCTNLASIPPTASAGGGLSFTAPTAGYVDYLDISGNPLGGGSPAPANWYYMRVWQITVPAGTTSMKQITVSAKARSAIGGLAGQLPQAAVTALKSYPF